MSIPPYKSKRLDFIGRPAPAGYVAGIGRGATGFTTRSDIGPAREAAAAAALAANSAAVNSGAAATAISSRGQASGSQDGPPKKLAKRNEEDEEDEYLNESNYDDFAGYGGSLVNKDPYEADDEEADKIYEAIDKHLDERGKALREAKIRQEREKYRQERPKIQQQFSDLKPSLSEVTEEEWYNIPEVGDARNRKQRVARQDKYTPVPDSLLAHQMKVASGGERMVYVDPDAMDTDDDDEHDDNNKEPDDDPMDALVQPSATSNSGGLNIGEMSDLRSSYMSAKLSHVSKQALDTTVDPKEYLKKYETLTPTQITDESTLKEFRKQYASLRKANPHMSNFWIASVRLEEAAGKLSTARALVLEACKRCPKSVDIWLEAVRIHPPDTAQSLMVKAIKENPRSVKLWIKAADLENDIHVKRKVYEKARDMVPKSALLWKKSVELEAPDEAGKILREAIQCCPDSVELFLALARLEPYEQAKEVLAKASERHPTERAVWIMKAKLEEAVGHDDMVPAIIETAIDTISKGGGGGEEIKRDEWLAEAADADKARFKRTCHEIIKHVIGLKQATATTTLATEPVVGAGEDDEKKTKGKEKERETKRRKRTATAGLVVAKREKDCVHVDGGDDADSTSRRKPPPPQEAWMEDIRKFVAGGSLECARAVYEFIVGDRSCRQVESNWISYAEFEQRHGTGESYESVLRRAVSSENCSKSESLWLLLAKFKRQNLLDTRQILSNALDANPDSERIFLEAVELECENGNYKEARRILADACMSAKTPQLVKRASKLEWVLGNLDEAVRMLKAGASEFKDYPDFYLMLGQIEEQRNNLDQAKIHYSDGLKFNPTSVELWISIASAEEKTGFHARARSKLEMARLRNPKCPLLWLESARFEIRFHQGKMGARRGGERPAIVSTILAKGIKECRDCADVDMLKAEQEAFNKRKFV